MLDLHLITVPHPFDSLSQAEVIAAADKLFDQVVAACTAKSLAHVRAGE
ncbi:MAG: hypothetical protein HYX94_06910 [Chloroflexi bacterium]|nr:hypothetical protein [Chloroflexota bacterium]